MSWSKLSDSQHNEFDQPDSGRDYTKQDLSTMQTSEFNFSSTSLGLDKGSLQDLDSASGELQGGYFQERNQFLSTSERDSAQETNWGYQILSPSEQDYSAANASFSEVDMSQSRGDASLGGGKSWPSLQIVCPDPPMYPSASMDRQPYDSPRGMQGSYGSASLGSPSRGPRDRMLGISTAQRPMSYYPVTPIAEEPLGYHKMNPSYPYSPTMRGGGGGGGYRSGGYGMPDSRGPMPMMSPARSPAVNRRFMEPVDGYVYQVQFKRAHKNFILAPSAPRNIIPGDFVKVEADRGEDMGIVLAKSLATQFEEVIPTAGYRGRGFSSGQGERKFLFRLANAEERAALVNKVQDEERALDVIRAKVLEQRLPMTILDAEYQFDRHKLTFFFEADRRIDFRELVSELFSLYKTRIWMQQVDTSALGLHDAGTELAKATGFLPQRDDKAYLQVSQMHRMESSTVGGGYSAAYQQPSPAQMNPWAAPSPPPRTPQYGTPAMGVGLGGEQELAAGLGLDEGADAQVSTPGRGGSGLSGSSGGIWGEAPQVTPQRPSPMPMASPARMHPLGSLSSMQQSPVGPPLQTMRSASLDSGMPPSPMLFSPQQPFGSPQPRQARFPAPPQPLQRAYPAQMQLSHMQDVSGQAPMPQMPPYGTAPGPPPTYSAGGYQAMGMVYEGESLLGPAFPPFSAPTVPVRPSRSLGASSFELNANAAPWPPAAAREGGRLVVERSESAEALLGVHNGGGGGGGTKRNTSSGTSASSASSAASTASDLSGNFLEGNGRDRERESEEATPPVTPSVPAAAVSPDAMESLLDQHQRLSLDVGDF